MTAGVALMPTPATLFDITISRDITKAFLSPYLSSVYHHGSALSISIKHFDEISNKIELKKTNKQEKYILTARIYYDIIYYQTIYEELPKEKKL